MTNYSGMQYIHVWYVSVYVLYMYLFAELDEDCYVHHKQQQNDEVQWAIPTARTEGWKWE